MTTKVKSKLDLETAVIILVIFIAVIFIGLGVYMDNANAKILRKLNDIQTDVWRYQYRSSEDSYKTVSPSECGWYDLSGSVTVNYVCTNTMSSSGTTTLTAKIGTNEYTTSISPYCTYTIANGYIYSNKCEYPAATTLTTK